MEPTEGSETSAIINQTPGNYPKENLLVPFYHLSVQYRQSPGPELNPSPMKNDIKVLETEAQTWIQIKLIQWHTDLETDSCAAGQNDLHTVTNVWIP